jgi:hypothetical protein
LPVLAILRLVRTLPVLAILLVRSLPALAILRLVRTLIVLTILPVLAILLIRSLPALAILRLILTALALALLALALLALALLTLPLLALALLALPLLTLPLLALALLTLALLTLALLTLPLLTLALLALTLALLFLLLLLVTLAHRELEVEPRVVEIRLLSQGLLVGLDRVLELALAHQQVAAVVAGVAADPGILRVRRLLEVFERALGQALLLGRVLGGLRLLEPGRAAIEGEAVAIDPAALRRAVVGGERVVIAAHRVGAVPGLDVGIRGPERLPAAEHDDEDRRDRAPHRACEPSSLGSTARPHAASG